MNANGNITNPGPDRAPLGTRRESQSHPSNGGSRGYSQDIREQVISMWQNGDDIAAPWLIPLRAQRKFPSLKTCRRWIRQFQQEGHARAKRSTGNHFSQREVHGQDLVNLALYRMVRPKAYLYEVAAYIHNRNPASPPYSNAQIFRAEVRLGLTRKVGSTTSDLAYLPENLRKRERYWNAAYPDGMAGLSTEDIIDLDEAKFKLESQNRKRGKVIRERRVNARGAYKRGEEGTNLLMCISGSEQTPFSFHRLYSEGGTDLQRFYEFMTGCLDYLDTNFPERRFIFTMDNLNIHKHPMILHLIHIRGHRVVFRAPYWSCDGPIEYVFNTIQYKRICKCNTIQWEPPLH
jgi:hypothetical protein